MHSIFIQPSPLHFNSKTSKKNSEKFFSSLFHKRFFPFFLFTRNLSSHLQKNRYFIKYPRNKNIFKGYSSQQIFFFSLKSFHRRLLDVPTKIWSFQIISKLYQFEPSFSNLSFTVAYSLWIKIRNASNFFFLNEGKISLSSFHYFSVDWGG